MNTKNTFLLVGILLIINGVLVYNGVELPTRGGKMIADPLSYGKNTIIWGISTIFLTLIISNVLNKKRN